MKTALLIVIIVIALFATAILVFRDPKAVALSAAQPWPGSTDGLDNTDARWPRSEASKSSVELAALAASLINQEAVDSFVANEITRTESTIGEAPSLPDTSAIRELLLREQISWQRYDAVGDENAIAIRGKQMALARALIASGLVKAKANNPGAWDDLHAVWKLARSLDGHPQMMAQTAALSMARMINAVAWKMPLPAPAWLGELQLRDDVRPMLDSFQHQAASYWYDGARFFPTKWLASSIDHDRKIAEDLYKFTGCDVKPPMNELGTDLTSLWRRLFRYRAEREATANALRIREGKAIETTSRCSDSGWNFDGATLRFSREIPTTAQDIAMPLNLQLKSAVK